MTKAATTRRAMLGAMTTVPVALMLPAATREVKAAAPDRRAWDELMARLDAAEAASARQERITDTIRERVTAETAKIPHVTVGGYDTQGAGRVTLSTANEHQVGLARRLTAKLPPDKDTGQAYDEYYANALKLVKADDRRKAQIEAISKRHKLGEAVERCNALSDECARIENQLLDMPAPDGEALMWKVRNLYTPGEGIWEGSLERQTFADLQRFLLTVSKH